MWIPDKYKNLNTLSFETVFTVYTVCTVYIYVTKYYIKSYKKEKKRKVKGKPTCFPLSAGTVNGSRVVINFQNT